MPTCRSTSNAMAAGPRSLFAHGFGGSGRNFRGQARALEHDHQSVLFDARGHGRSAAPQAASLVRAFDCFVADVGRVLDGAQRGTRRAFGG